MEADMRTWILSLIIAALAPLLFALDCDASFDEEVRQALQLAVQDVQKSLSSAGLPAGPGISLLPLRNDQDKYVEGLLKSAVTTAGLTYVEGKSDPFWDEVLKEIEWDERKADILDPATLVTFGKLKATKMLMYGTVRETTVTGQKVFVELELHLSSIETKKHLWGGNFARRFYRPGEVEGLVSLDADLRTLLQELFEREAISLGQVDKLKTIKNVALVPIAADIDGYIQGLVESMLTRTNLTPMDLDVHTLSEARALLRDKPGQADAILYGAVRDLSRRLKRKELMKKTYEVSAEIQLKIQAAPGGEILWSETLTKTQEKVEEKTGEEAAVGFFEKHPMIVVLIIVGIVVLILGVLYMRGAKRPR